MFICNGLSDAPCWTTVWTGVSAVATIALLIAAVVAGATGYFLLRTESNRDKRAEEQARRAQANLIAAWPRLERMDSGTMELEIGAWVRNASHLPIYDMTVMWEERGAPRNGGVARLPIVPPDAEPKSRNADGAFLIKVPNDSAQAQWDGLATARIAIGFRDAAGAYWYRHFDGVLFQLAGNGSEDGT